jgi:hypothetical protein
MNRTLLLSTLERGQPPDPATASEMLVDFDDLLREWVDDLERYVANGGSLLRVVSGAPGSGKTHLGRAIRYAAAKRNFVTASVDVQANLAEGSELALHKVFCEKVISPREYVSGNAETGLVTLMRELASKLTYQQALQRLGRLPVPFVGELFVESIRHIRAHGALTDDWNSAINEVLPGSWKGPLAPLSRRLKLSVKRPTQRTAHLWTQSVLLATQRLGYAGTVMVLDEHDNPGERAIHGSIAQLRAKLDGITQARLPGTFVLYLVLDNFLEKIASQHSALEQRLRPLTPLNCPGTRMYGSIYDLRSSSGEAHLMKIGHHFARIVGITLTTEQEERMRSFARDELKVSGLRTVRPFVMRVARDLLQE